MTSNRSFLRAAAAATIFAGLLMGCANDKPASGGGTSDGKPVVALVMKSLANEFFQTMQKGAEGHQKEHAGDYALLSNGIKDEGDVAKQQQIVEQMTSQAKAIVIAPADSKAMVAVCARAIEAGVPVVNIDNKFDDEVLKQRGIRIPFVGPDNRKGARMAAEYLASKLQRGDKLAILEGIPTAYNGIQRLLGFQDAIKAAGLEVVASQSARWETAEASNVASAILTSHPEIKAILCANDSMALGAVAALKAVGRDGKVLVIGFDDISAAENLIREGKMLATVNQEGDKVAVYGIQYALDILAKRAEPVDKETPVRLVTQETLK